MTGPHATQDRMAELEPWQEDFAKRLLALSEPCERCGGDMKILTHYGRPGRPNSAAKCESCGLWRA